jgi:hypothetical protein
LRPPPVLELWIAGVIEPAREIRASHRIHVVDLRSLCAEVFGEFEGGDDRGTTAHRDRERIERVVVVTV